MDETGVFFRVLPERGLVEKKNKAKGGKRSKLRMTAAFFVSGNGGKVCDPVIIWRSKNPRCFRRIVGPKKTPKNVQYYHDPKSWMQTSIMEDVLKKLNSKLIKEKRNVILFLDNATCHPVTLDALVSNITVRFLPKNTTSKLQMLDAGIIRCFKAKYRKKLVSYIVSRINAGKSATEITKDVTGHPMDARGIE